MTRGGGGAGGWGELVVPSGDLAGKWTSPTILSEGEFVRETCLSPPPPPLKLSVDLAFVHSGSHVI